MDEKTIQRIKKLQALADQVYKIADGRIERKGTEL